MSLPNAILGVLTYSPMTGYNLGKIFSKSINYSWTASLSQIYRELGTLEKKGYVSSNITQQDDRPDKKIYRITEDGRAAFSEWLMDFPETFSSPKRDDFALRIFFGSKVGNKELIKQFKRFIEDREHFREIMAEGEKMVIEMIKTSKDSPVVASMKENKLYWNFIIKRALMTNDVFIKWAKDCIYELEGYEMEGRE